jgi:hypothetical protein
MKEVAEGRDWSEVGGISYRRDGKVYHNLDRLQLTNAQLDELPS